MSSKTEQPPKQSIPTGAQILVVEDDADLQEVLQVQLEFNGFVPVCVKDGKEALEWLQSHQPALIILDLMLPGMDGIKLCQRIRSEFSLNHLPILMLSALGSKADTRIRGLLAGANDFLAKPYNLGELITKIQILLRARTKEESLEELLARYVASPIRARAEAGLDSVFQRQTVRAAILFADLRGFTRLSALIDIDELISRLDQFFESMMAIIDHHGGTVIDLVGDELLAIFYVSDESAKQSIEAALHMQQAFPKIRDGWAKASLHLGLGIGIHYGQVMLGDVGGKALMRYTVTGKVVNVAHRLVDLAQPGEIVISSEVYHIVESDLAQLRFAAMPPIQLKGIDEPQQIYKLQSLRDAQSKQVISGVVSRLHVESETAHS